jgi:hypothetical protein
MLRVLNCTGRLLSAVLFICGIRYFFFIYTSPKQCVESFKLLHIGKTKKDTGVKIYGLSINTFCSHTTLCVTDAAKLIVAQPTKTLLLF